MCKSLRVLLLTILSLLALSPVPTLAGTTLLIWPLDPTIESGQKTGTIWLENVGKSPVTLQIRLFAWEQVDFKDRLSEQSVVISTPPFTTIEPGKKQLVRFTLTAPIMPGEERASRVLIDEIPVSSPAESSGLKLQMRYSLPLFAYGDGLWRKESGRKPGHARAQPSLSWRFVEEGESRHIEVRNSGTGHARLSQVRLMDHSAGAPPGSSGNVVDIAPGLLGYVLPGRVMRWPAPARQGAGRHLQVQLEPNSPPVMLPSE